MINKVFLLLLYLVFFLNIFLWIVSLVFPLHYRFNLKVTKQEVVLNITYFYLCTIFFGVLMVFLHIYIKENFL